MTNTTSEAPAAARPLGLSIASTLSWLVGILLGLAMASALIPAVFAGKWPVLLFLVTAIAVGFCVSGYGLRKQRLYGGWTAIATAGVWLAMRMGTGVGVGPLQVLLIGGLAVLVIANWKYLA